MVDKKLNKVCSYQSVWQRYSNLHKNGSFKQQFLKQIRKISKQKIQQLKGISFDHSSISRNNNGDYDYVVKIIVIRDYKSGKR